MQSRTDHACRAEGELDNHLNVRPIPAPEPLRHDVSCDHEGEKYEPAEL